MPQDVQKRMEILNESQFNLMKKLGNSLSRSEKRSSEMTSQLAKVRELLTTSELSHSNPLANTSYESGECSVRLPSSSQRRVKNLENAVLHLTHIISNLEKNTQRLWRDPQVRFCFQRTKRMHGMMESMWRRSKEIVGQRMLTTSLQSG